MAGACEACNGCGKVDYGNGSFQSCYLCDGSGKNVICDSCKGQGKVRQKLPPYARESQCGWCNGTGIYNDAPCTSCRGGVATQMIDWDEGEVTCGRCNGTGRV